jgi:hypothetical protein
MKIAGHDSGLATRPTEHYKNIDARLVRPHRPVAAHCCRCRWHAHRRGSARCVVGAGAGARAIARRLCDRQRGWAKRCRVRHCSGAGGEGAAVAVAADRGRRADARPVACHRPDRAGARRRCTGARHRGGRGGAAARGRGCGAVRGAWHRAGRERRPCTGFRPYRDAAADAGGRSVGRYRPVAAHRRCAEPKRRGDALGRGGGTVGRT